MRNKLLDIFKFILLPLALTFMYAPLHSIVEAQSRRHFIILPLYALEFGFIMLYTLLIAAISFVAKNKAHTAVLSQLIYIVISIVIMILATFVGVFPSTFDMVSCLPLFALTIGIFLANILKSKFLKI